MKEYVVNIEHENNVKVAEKVVGSKELDPKQNLTGTDTNKHECENFNNELDNINKLYVCTKLTSGADEESFAAGPARATPNTTARAISLRSI